MAVQIAGGVILSSLYASPTGTDIDAYVSAANSIGTQNYASMSSSGDSFRPPGLPFLIYLANIIFGENSLHLLIIFQIIVLCGTFFLAYSVILRNSGPLAGRIVAPIFIHPETLNLAVTVSPDFFNFICIVLMTVVILNKSYSTRKGVLAVYGLIAVSLYFKPILLFLPAFILLYFAVLLLIKVIDKSVLGLALVGCIVVVIAAAPWTLRNYFLTGNASFSSAVSFNYVSYIHAIERERCRCGDLEAISRAEKFLQADWGVVWDGQLVSNPHIFESPSFSSLARNSLVKMASENPYSTTRAFVRGWIRGLFTPHNIYIHSNNDLAGLSVAKYFDFVARPSIAKLKESPLLLLSLAAVVFNITVVVALVIITVVSSQILVRSVERLRFHLIGLVIFYLTVTVLPWSNNIRYMISTLAVALIFMAHTCHREKYREGANP